MDRRAWLEGAAMTAGAAGAVSLGNTVHATSAGHCDDHSPLVRRDVRRSDAKEIEPGVEALTSVVSPASLIKIVQRQYDFGEIEQCIFLRRNLNDVYALRLANSERRIIRLAIPQDHRRSNVEYETTMLRHLKRGGASVAAPCATTSGRYWFDINAPEGSRTLVSFEYLEGVAVGGDLEHIKLMGFQLARIHDVARSYRGPPSKRTLDALHLVHIPTQRILDFCKEQGRDTRRIDSISSCLAQRIDSRTLSRVACHGDVHASNALVTRAPDGRKLASFFDFDDSGPGYLAYDLSGYLRWIVRATGKVVLDESVVEKWTAFLAGYQWHSAIPEEDLNAVWTFATAGYLWWIGEIVGIIRREGVSSTRSKLFHREIDILAGLSLVASSCIEKRAGSNAARMKRRFD